MNPHLLFVLPDLSVGGAQFMNPRVLRALARRGWPVEAAVLFERPNVPLIKESYRVGVPWRFLRAKDLLDKAFLPLRLAALARRADLVIAGMEYAATNYGYLAARLARRPFISWTHIAFGPHQYAAGPLDRLISRWVYRRTRDVVFPSYGALDSLQQALGVRPSGARWHVIENFLEKPPPPPTEGPPDSQMYSKPVLIGVGRLCGQKAFHRLIRAHAALRGQGIDHHLVIVGEGPERVKLQELILDLGVESSAFLPGHVANPWPWLCHAQIFALCSRYEGLPLALMEAMKAGLPCVAMDCPGGLREVLQNGAFGLLTPAEDEGAFQAALARLFGDANLRWDLSAKARLRASYYTEERILPQWESLLRQVIKEGIRWG
ncbi:glycosyltransferase [Desulfosoma caldarium]|uniref:Glycosyltransferase involved in cell wall biosynthesis n=1 Tax=Desulfosoma caldarium TaxID=610254 RepID=A0A3N1UKW0_9BACT|nr:glycosyltransferase [Desulfosoma caldarium]ROQ90783.1 glycosyltransferase involved in cell wall biosynthesis [Desulfosoma caldarium]